MSTEEFLNCIYPLFHKVILLTRKNLLDASISYKRALENNRWHEYYHISNKDKYVDELIYNSFYLNNKKIEYLSKEWHIPITYYEDLFSGKESIVRKTLEIALNDEKIYQSIYKNLHPSKKYRRFESII